MMFYVEKANVEIRATLLWQVSLAGLCRVRMQIVDLASTSICSVLISLRLSSGLSSNIN